MIGDVVIGPHAGLTGWVFDTVVELAALAGRPVQHVDRTDHIDFAVAARPIIITNYPNRQLIEAIESNAVSVTLVIEDPIDVVLYLRSVTSQPLLEIIRAQTSSAVANLAIASTKEVLYIDRSSERPIGQTVARLAQHLGIATSHAATVLAVTGAGLGEGASIEELLSARGDHYFAPARRTPGVVLDSDHFIAAEVIDPLIAMARQDYYRPIVWSTPVFRAYDQPDLPARQGIEIAGPVRNIYYGPYFYLPPARYRVETVLNFSDEISSVPFVLEMHGAAWLAKARIDEHRAGRYRGYFHFDHTNAETSVEIRLRNARGVEQGRLSLIEMLFFVDSPT